MDGLDPDDREGQQRISSMGPVDPQIEFSSHLRHCSKRLQPHRVSGPIIKDQLYGRIAYSYRDTDGQFKNKFTGSDDSGNNWEETAVRGRMIWEPSDKLTVDAIASYREVKGGAINFNAVFALDQAAAGTGITEFAEDVNDHNFKYINNVEGKNIE